MFAFNSVLCDIDNYVVAKDVKDVGERVERLQLDDHQRQIKGWLSAPDPSTNYMNALEKRHKGTGLWFTRSKAFKRWKEQPDSFLWLHGIAGCGKTVLSSTIIEHLKTDIGSGQLLLYFYFDFNDPKKQTFENMLRSLTHQLYQKQSEARGTLNQLWELYRDSDHLLTKQSLSANLLAMLSEVSDTSIVLDALDEASTRSDILAWLKNLRETKLSIRFLVTARSEQEIETAFHGWTQPESWISIRDSDIDKDIRVYVRHMVRHSSELERWQSRPDVQDEIEAELIEGADGM